MMASHTGTNPYPIKQQKENPSAWGLATHIGDCDKASPGLALAIATIWGVK